MDTTTSVPNAYANEQAGHKVQGASAGASLTDSISGPESDPEKGIDNILISRYHELRRAFSNDDEDNPRNWTPRKKCAIAFFALFSAFVATFGTGIYNASIIEVAAKYHLGTTLAISPISLYPYGLGLGAGIFAGPCLTVGVGILNDLWDLSLDKTGTTFAVLYALFIIYATQIGPIVSGSLITYHSWRWTFWLPAILVGVQTLGSFRIPETYGPQILRTRAKKEGRPLTTRTSSVNSFLVSISRPLHMIIVEPLILPSGLVLSVTQSVVFAYYVAYAILFEDVYNFSQYHVGLAFTPLLVGGVLAVPIIAAFDKLTYQKARAHAIASRTTVHPETRLYPAMLGVILLPISLFWLAWTGRPEVHWIVPVLSGILFGMSYVLNMFCIPIYNNDVYMTHYGASVMAATTFMRFTVSSPFPLFTEQMVHKLAFAWAISLLGFVTIAMIPVPWVFFKWGPALRSKSRYLRD